MEKCDCVLDNIYKFTIRLDLNNGRLWIPKLVLSKALENDFKSFNFKHHIQFLRVSKKYDVTPKGFKIKQMAKIHPASNSFINEWRTSIKDTERQLITKVFEENRKNLTAQLNNSENNIAVCLKKKDDMTVIQKMNSSQNVDNEHLDTLQNNILKSSANQDGTESEQNLTDLVEIVANLIKDDIPPTLNVSEQDLCSYGEMSNTTYACQINEESNRIKGKFVSDNVFNLSRRNNTDDKLSMLSKNLSFVPTPEKIDRWQVKNNLTKFGRNIRSTMYFLNEPSPSFSEVLAFKTPSKWTPNIKDTHLVLFPSEVEDEIM